jgi:hypothetical protein
MGRMPHAAASASLPTRMDATADQCDADSRRSVAVGAF